MDPAARARTLERVLASAGCQVTAAAFHTARARALAAATANGNRRYFQSSEAAFSLTARTPDGTGAGYLAGDHFDLDRLDVTAIAAQAVDKAVRSAKPRPIEPGTYPVILEPQAVSDLLRFLTGAFDARMADEGRSAFSLKGGKTRVGEALFDKRLSIYSDPMHAELPAIPATAEGVPATRLPLVTDGVLEQLDYSRFWAERQKRAPSPGPVNFIVEGRGTAATIEQMVAGMERGLLVSRFWYVRLVDPRTLALTGLTRDGLWWIEKGRISHPVGNLRFNQSVLAMLAPWNVEAIGAPRRLSPLVVPALRLAGFTFTLPPTPSERIGEEGPAKKGPAPFSTIGDNLTGGPRRSQANVSGCNGAGP